MKPNTKSRKTNPLRWCFESLATNAVGAPEDLPRILGREARGVLLRVRGGRDTDSAAVEDLVSEFLAELVARGARRGGLPAIAREWLEWPDARLVATVRRVMRNLAVEQSPNWDLLRGLRAMVKEVLEKGLPAADALPETLLVKGRLEAGRVAKACAWVVANFAERAPGGALSVAAIANELLQHYQLGEGLAPKAELDEAPTRPEEQQAGTPASQLEVARDGHHLAGEFLERAGVEAGVLLVQRCNGEGFAELAMRFRIGLATVHGRVRAAFDSFGATVRAHEATHEDAEEAIRALRSRLSGSSVA